MAKFNLGDIVICDYGFLTNSEFLKSNDYHDTVIYGGSGYKGGLIFTIDEIRDSKLFLGSYIYFGPETIDGNGVHEAAISLYDPMVPLKNVDNFKFV